jgi:hypothetical protein
MAGRPICSWINALIVDYFVAGKPHGLRRCGPRIT